MKENKNRICVYGYPGFKINEATIKGINCFYYRTKRFIFKYMQFQILMKIIKLLKLKEFLPFINK